MASAIKILQKEKEEHKELAEKEMGLMHRLMENLSVRPPGLLSDSAAHDDADTIKSRAETMEKIIQNENESLTFEEREQANFDVHGLVQLGGGGSCPNEGPSIEEQGKLVELDAELIRLGVDTGRANPLIQDQAYRLMFLRCDQLEVKVAAQRIQKNIQVKRELFGDHCLHREIALSDLDKDDLEALHSGFARVSNHKDIAGRTVVVVQPQIKIDHLPTRAYHRAQFYHMSQVTRSYSCQKQGAVIVVLHVGLPHCPREMKERHSRTPARMLEMRHIKAAIPKKLGAMHFCVVEDGTSANGFTAQASNLRRMFFNTIQMMMPADARSRFRKHYGSKERIEFELAAFGITMEPEDWQKMEDHAATTPNETHTIPINVDPTPLAEMTDDTPMIDPSSFADIAYMMDTDLDPIPLLPMQTTRGVSIGSSVTSTSTTYSMDGSAWDSSTNGTPAEPSASSNSTRRPSVAPKSTISSTAGNIIPTDEDILFGRGRKTMNHPGNLHLRELVNLHRDDYENASKQRKTVIALNIADTILQSNRRFLKYEPEEDRWVHADVQTARNKISHIYRNTRTKKGN